MSANQIEIICLCGDHIQLTKAGDNEAFLGYCIGCNRHWLLNSNKTLIGKNDINALFVTDN